MERNKSQYTNCSLVLRSSWKLLLQDVPMPHYGSFSKHQWVLGYCSCIHNAWLISIIQSSTNAKTSLILMFEDLDVSKGKRIRINLVLQRVSVFSTLFQVSFWRLIIVFFFLKVCECINLYTKPANISKYPHNVKAH